MNTAIEAARAGMIFSRYENRRQYESWRRKHKIKRAKDSGEQVGLTGQALETAIMGFAAMHPEYVVMGEG